MDKMKTYTVTVDAAKTKRWYLNDKLHREDGPAVEYADGTKHWYLNDNLHREDGPASVWADGTKYWYVNGEQLTALRRENAELREALNLAFSIQQMSDRQLADLIRNCRKIIGSKP